MQDPRLYISNPIVETPEWGKQIKKYGTYWDVQSDLALELDAFRQYWSEEEGGLGPAQHLINAYKIAFPQYLATWHNWTEERFTTLSQRESVGSSRPLYKSVVMSGAASTTKSRDTGYYDLLWWLADPSNRAVIVLSTTGEALRRRIWNYIENGWREFPEAPGHITKHPMPKILFDPDDSVHGIHGFAIPEGSAKKTIQNMIGIHPKGGLRVVVDEAPDMPTAVNDALPNLEAGQEDFQVVYLGNGDNRFNLHGLMMEPLAGWQSVNPHIHTMWPTTQQKGICLYYSAFKSPAVLDPTNKELAKFLPTAEYIHDTISARGEDDPVVWRQIYGFPPPDGHEIKTILTPTLCDFHNVTRRVEWSGNFKMRLAALDPSFTQGGDECILQYADWGETVDGDWVLDYGGDENVVVIPISATSKEPPSYQVMRLARAHCESQGIPPHRFGADTSGTGIGLGDIMVKEWSPNIIRIHTNGPASEEFIDGDQRLRACDLYDRKITELWFKFQRFVTNNQIVGLDRTSIEQFCLRTYEKKPGTSRVRLITKKEYKSLYGKAGKKSASPDRADAKIIVMMVAIINGFKMQQALQQERRSDEEARRIYLSVLDIASRQAQTQQPVTYDEWDESFAGDLMDGDFAESDSF